MWSAIISTLFLDENVLNTKLTANKPCCFETRVSSSGLLPNRSHPPWPCLEIERERCKRLNPPECLSKLSKQICCASMLLEHLPNVYLPCRCAVHNKYPVMFIAIFRLHHKVFSQSMTFCWLTSERIELHAVALKLDMNKQHTKTFSFEDRNLSSHSMANKSIAATCNMSLARSESHQAKFMQLKRAKCGHGFQT